ncbi:MAG: hypothetical protein DRQ78_01355 [Epsilonproteobacteria bacterium]|nr:MAG: hypothetical protein DRQ78_01355 [Campylobacterota bacterium]
MLEVDRLFIEFPEIANKYKSKFRFVFVDEFQDTSNTQYRILKNLTDRNSNLTIVGDPDQNIYS